MNKKTLILGKGFIGSRLQEELGCGISDKRILCLKDIEGEIKRHQPETIINCIGHIGRNVDECEKDPDKTLMANSFVPFIIAEAALRNKISLVQVSSGCLYHYDYNLDSPVDEDMVPDFFELFYSRSKIYSDRGLEVLSRRFPVLIVRLRVPLDNRPHPRNLLDKLIGFKNIIDLPNSVTYIPDFIKALNHLMAIGAKGIYNVVNKGGLRYPELMEVYKKYAPDFRYQVVDFPKLNLIRTNLIMSTDKLEKTDFKVRDIHEVLEECVRGYLKKS